MTDLPTRPSTSRLAMIAPAAIVSIAGLGLLAWLDWSRRKPRLKARTADRLF
ncbi:hypothetical protein [uncultured Sphingomonas sp.]|uniref:hypothetical protein n=1 Tax=uncultured Sphingomonas sp. TaxID=158754 RepID=UPI0035CB660A